MKHDLALRPIHHQLEHRIESRIFVAFVPFVTFAAYSLQITLKANLKQHAAGLTPRSVIAMGTDAQL